MRHIFFAILLWVGIASFAVDLFGAKRPGRNFERAKETVDSIYMHYGVQGEMLLRENFPFSGDYSATYLAAESNAQNPYSYLWPFSGTLTAVNTLSAVDSKYVKMLEKRVMPGLEHYLDASRKPSAYASYINSTSDRFYDDNVWLGIDFCEIYETTGDKKWIDRAEMVWRFIESGMDDKLGGGIYWCEQSKKSKNTCSNAPGTVYAMKLFEITGKPIYLKQAKALYQWTKSHLMDKSDYLYFDNQSLDGKVSEAKYAYNSGQMVHAGALLYKATNDEKYLKDAQQTAKACHNHFFRESSSDDGASMARVIKDGNLWFSAVMVRGLIELYAIDGNRVYVNDVQRSLDYAWSHSRDEHGLFTENLSGKQSGNRKWLLTQAAFAEMFARMELVE